MRAARAMRYWPAGLPEMQTAMRSRTPQFSRICCASMYVSRLPVHLFGDLAQREFAEGNEIAAAKES